MSKELLAVMQLVAVTFSGVNFLALIVVAIKAGKLLQSFDSVVERVRILEERQDKHSELIFRTAEALNGIEVRVGLLERRS